MVVTLGVIGSWKVSPLPRRLPTAQNCPPATGGPARTRRAQLAFFLDRKRRKAHPLQVNKLYFQYSAL